MRQRKLVLVVDDHPGILRITQSILTFGGFDVLTAGNGKEGLELAKSAQPDLILLDLLMGQVSGLQVLGELRKSSNLPVIVFTAHKESIAEALAKGANDVIKKPFLPEELLNKIDRLLKPS